MSKATAVHSYTPATPPIPALVRTGHIDAVAVWDEAEVIGRRHFAGALSGYRVRFPDGMEYDTRVDTVVPQLRPRAAPASGIPPQPARLPQLPWPHRLFRDACALLGVVA